MALILVRPHTSLLDAPAVAFFLWKQCGRRDAIFVIDPNYARHPVWSRLLKTYGWLIGGHTMLSLDAKQPHVLSKLAWLLEQDRDVVLFPQGPDIGNPGRPDIKAIDVLVEYKTWINGEERRVMIRAREMMLSHDGFFPRVISYVTIPMGDTPYGGRY